MATDKSLWPSSGNKKWLKSDHVWRTEDGFIDMFATDMGFHNGPICTVCGYTNCWHCQDTPPPCKSAR